MQTQKTSGLNRQSRVSRPIPGRECCTIIHQTGERAAIAKQNKSNKYVSFDEMKKVKNGEKKNKTIVVRCDWLSEPFSFFVYFIILQHGAQVQAIQR